MTSGSYSSNSNGGGGLAWNKRNIFRHLPTGWDVLEEPGSDDRFLFVNSWNRMYLQDHPLIEQLLGTVFPAVFATTTAAPSSNLFTLNSNSDETQQDSSSGSSSSKRKLDAALLLDEAALTSSGAEPALHQNQQQQQEKFAKPQPRSALKRQKLAARGATNELAWPSEQWKIPSSDETLESMF